MKKLQPIALTLMLLLPLFLSTTTWGSLVASPITGHAGITLTLSDNLGSASASLNIGTIAFGTRQITVGTHNLAASKGTLSGDAIVTDANGEYQVTFNVPDLAANTYSIRVGGRTTPFSDGARSESNRGASWHPLNGVGAVWCSQHKSGSDSV